MILNLNRGACEDSFSLSLFMNNNFVVNKAIPRWLGHTE